MENVKLENLSKEELLNVIHNLQLDFDKLKARYDSLNQLRFKLEERLLSINLLSEV